MVQFFDSTPFTGVWHAAQLFSRKACDCERFPGLAARCAATRADGKCMTASEAFAVFHRYASISCCAGRADRATVAARFLAFMTSKPAFGPGHPHPLSQLKTELVWDGKYDEYGNRRTVDIAGCAMPLQKIETIDEPRSRAAALGQTELFEMAHAKAQRNGNRRLSSLRLCAFA